MSDFPPQRSHVKDLPEGGQGHTFVVRRADASDNKLYVLKRLKNLKRRDYFEREIQVCKNLEHANILKVIESGETPKGKPYLITEYCDGGSLADATACSTPLAGLRLFEQIVSGVAQAHANDPAIAHLDLKPENILLRAGVPVVGDFGVCFVDENTVSMTKEGARGSIYYCAPELRNPKIPERPLLKSADIYSLGKIVYFIFTNDVYDGHEEEYGNDHNRQLAKLFTECPQFAFVDELVAATVQRKPTDRVRDAIQLLNRVNRVINRIEAGGRVLDLRIPQRCLYCAEGRYRPAHELTPDSRGGNPVDKFPKIDERRAYRDQHSVTRPTPYDALLTDAKQIIGEMHNRTSILLFLICDFCGNVQYFRLDRTADKHGEHWMKPIGFCDYGAGRFQFKMSDRGGALVSFVLLALNLRNYRGGLLPDFNLRSDDGALLRTESQISIGHIQ